MRAWRRVVAPLLFSAVALGLAIAALAAIGQIRAERGDVALAPLGLAVMALALQVALLALAWHRLLGGIATARQRSFRFAVRSFVLGWLSRYIPGPPTGPAGKYLACRQGGYSNGQIGVALFYENVLQVLAGAAASALTLGFVLGARFSLLTPLLLGAAALLGATLLAPSVIARVARLLGNARLTSFADVAPMPLRELLFPAGLMLAAALVAGFSFHLVAVTLTDWPMREVGRALFVFSAASFVGYVTPFAPSGAGVREALIVAGLGPHIGHAEALSAALVARAVAILLDAALGVLLAALYVVSTLNRRALGSPLRWTSPSKNRA